MPGRLGGSRRAAIIAIAALIGAFPARAQPAKTAPDRPNIVILLADDRSEEHTSELQSLMRISYAVFCLKKKNKTKRDRSTRETYTMNIRSNYYKATI